MGKFYLNDGKGEKNFELDVESPNDFAKINKPEGQKSPDHNKLLRARATAEKTLQRVSRFSPWLCAEVCTTFLPHPPQEQAASINI